MTKEFVTYEQAVALRDIGFDYGCLAQYGDTEEGIGFEIWNDENYHMWENSVGAPLKQQVFRWAREKHDLHSEIFVDDNKTFGFLISYFIEDGRANHVDANDYSTYEEAESACIDKLIELVKNK